MQNRIARRVTLAMILTSSLMVAGCGGGASTEALPAVTLPQTSNYTGPAPATADVQSFMLNLWDNIARPDRCGACHSQNVGQSPMFARTDDVNLAYDAALALVDLGSPSDSRLVTKVGGGHNCWEAVASVCADIMASWIGNWAGNATGAAARMIQLQAPVIQDVGLSKTFPADPTLFSTTVYPLLDQFCSDCHNSSSATPQAPFFAESNVAAAYDAVRQKINLDDPAASRLVNRLRFEFHNCWTASCTSDSNDMQTQIENFAAGIIPTPVDPNLVVSKALTMYDGIIASGGNRYEANQIALWEFKAGQGSTAFDTSGVDPAINLTLSGEVDWVGGWGIDIKSGKAQGSTSDSKKLHDLIKSAGEYSIEAWVVPGNVAQEESRIVSYSAGTAARNMHLGQTLYSYDFYNRSGTTDGNGEPFLTTSDADEDLQATLQYVVATYDPINGRQIYVNGIFTDDPDPVGGSTLTDWDDTFAFVLGNEVSGNRQWQGVLRMVAVHNRALNQTQILQNFDVGVGEKFFLLFSLQDLVTMPQAYILIEVSQFDSYSYLFNEPIFVSLDPAATPGSIPIQGMRIGMNGSEATAGQVYMNLDVTVTDGAYTSAGQPLSSMGTVIALENGPGSDEFFLSFDLIAGNTNVRTPTTPLAPTPVDLPPSSDIGVKTFDEINATMSAITGVPTTDSSVAVTYALVKTQLPTVENIEAFSAAHEIGVAQLAIEYCNSLVENAARRTAYFPNVVFTVQPSVALIRANLVADPLVDTNRDLILTPLIDNAMNIGLGSQPAFADVRDELGYIVTPDYTNLIDSLIASDDSNGQRTMDITKAVCAAVIGSAVTIIQ